jgi:hypothetical protein
MRTLADLVIDVLSLSNTDMDTLAQALAIHDIRKADRLKFLLTTHIQEEDAQRLRDWNNMKDAA